MPIEVAANLARLTQHQFANVAYRVVNEAFSVHNEFGSLFDETVYRNALISRLNDATAEVRIDVKFHGFHKSYFIDVVVDGGGVFECKAVKKLDSNHRSQLMNYLLLTGMNHGKLINFGPTQVEHEFVNTQLTHADRINFTVNDVEWNETDGFGEREKNLVSDLLHDWGTGLDGALYRDALLHFLGGEDRILRKVKVFRNGRCVGQQAMPLCGDGTIIRLTTFQDREDDFLPQLSRLMQRTGLDCAQRINVSRKKVTFKTLHISVQNISVTKP